MLQKTTVLILMIVLFQNSLLAQDKVQIDSLKLVVNSDTITSDDIIKIALKIARLNRRVNPEEQAFYARKAFLESQKISDIKMQGISLSEIATYHQNEDNYDSAYYYFEKTIPFFKSEKNVGNVYSRLSNIEKARGNYVESIKLLITSDSIFETIDFRQGRLANNTNLGILLSTKGDYKEAISYYKKAEALLSEKDDRTKSILYTNFGITYGELGDLEKSKKYVEESITLKKKFNDINGLASAYGNLSMIASKEGNEALSIRYMEDALQAYQKMNNKNGITGSYNQLGNVYRLQGNYDKAEDYLLRANVLSQETNNHSALLSNQESLYKLYRDKKKWNKAYTHLASYSSLKDSITVIEKIKITKELRTKYETDRILKDKALAESNSALAEQKAENNKNFANSIAAIAALILALILFVFYRFKSKKKEELLSVQLQETENRLQLEQQTRVSELKALQAQMNPHFVFNALNSIQDLILLQDIRNSNKYLGKFSDLIRRVLGTSSKGSISITEEIEMLKLYAELEQLRFGEQLKINFVNEVSETISDDFSLPPMFIQPYIENALKHGLFNKEGAKNLEVHFYIKDEHIVCKIEDNGVGRIKAQKLKDTNNNAHLGFATDANLERIELLNKGKERKITVIIEDKNDQDKASGTSVFINFPFEISNFANQ